MGLYLYSRPIKEFFKRSIRLWSQLLDHWRFDSSFNLELIHNNSSILHIHIKNKIQTQVIINRLISYFSTYTYVYILHPLFSGVSIEGFLYTNATQSTPFVRTASIESLHLSFPFFFSRFLNPCLFSENRIWLRIAHFYFQGFSEFESFHLVGFHTKAQSNQVRSVYQFRHIPFLFWD